MFLKNGALGDQFVKLLERNYQLYDDIVCLLLLLPFSRLRDCHMCYGLTHSGPTSYITSLVWVTIREETYFCLVDLFSVFWSRDSSSVACAYHPALFPNTPTKLHILEEIERSYFLALNIERIHL